MRFALLFLFFPLLSLAQTNAPPAAVPAPVSSQSASGNGKPAAAKGPHSPVTAAQMQAALDQLTQSNRDLLDLLKKQQAVLEDMQFDRRLQSREIESLDPRLEDTLL